MSNELEDKNFNMTNLDNDLAFDTGLYPSHLIVRVQARIVDNNNEIVRRRRRAFK